MLPYEVEEALTTLGGRVSAVRRTLGWTQEDLAAKAGVNKKTVLNVEHGRPSVGIGHLLSHQSMLAQRWPEVVESVGFSPEVLPYPAQTWWAT